MPLEIGSFVCTKEKNPRYGEIIDLVPFNPKSKSKKKLWIVRFIQGDSYIDETKSSSQLKGCVNSNSKKSQKEIVASKCSPFKDPLEQIPSPIPKITEEKLEGLEDPKNDTAITLPFATVINDDDNNEKENSHKKSSFVVNHGSNGSNDRNKNSQQVLTNEKPKKKTEVFLKSETVASKSSPFKELLAKVPSSIPNITKRENKTIGNSEVLDDPQNDTDIPLPFAMVINDDDNDEKKNSHKKSSCLVNHGSNDRNKNLQQVLANEKPKKTKTSSPPAKKDSCSFSSTSPSSGSSGNKSLLSGHLSPKGIVALKEDDSSVNSQSSIFCPQERVASKEDDFILVDSQSSIVSSSSTSVKSLEKISWKEHAIGTSLANKSWLVSPIYACSESSCNRTLCTEHEPFFLLIYDQAIEHHP